VSFLLSAILRAVFTYHCHQGTRVFIARAVQQGRPISLPNVVLVPPIPPSPEPYTRNHPNRIEKFPLKGRLLVESASSDSVNRPWRHDLEHDAESVFWLLLYWVLVAQPAQPAQPAQEYVRFSTWALLIGCGGERDGLLWSLRNTLESEQVAHSFYRPLAPLLRRLAAILIVDRYWLDTSETRNSEEYVPEAFQRLILQFILENSSKDFMTHPVDRQIRQLEVIRYNLGLPGTTSAENRRKRPSPQSSTQRMKRPRLDKEVTKVRAVDVEPSVSCLFLHLHVFRMLQMARRRTCTKSERWMTTVSE
jgi:hypothetical protein